jgi:hypothetical protein
VDVLKLHPQVHVYRNYITNSKDIVARLEEKATWEQWWIFGKMAKNVGPSFSWSSFPSPSEWEEHLKDIKDNMNSSLIDEIVEVKRAFYEVTSHYREEHSFELDNWVIPAPSFNVYIPNEKDQPGATSMGFHTDYQQEKADARGDKFMLTCTMYLGGEFEGGEIAFVITENPSDESTYNLIKYKPQEGDIIVFPSTPPFHHGVTKVTSGIRYMVRTFWLEHFPGTPEWLAGEAEHGEEAWAEMEKEREQRELHVIDRIHDLKLNL